MDQRPGIWGEHPRTLSRNYRVVAIDLAGHGESGSDRDEWTMASFGRDVVAVVEHLELN
jgi:sigma-B regulation protein RsbQ